MTHSVALTNDGNDKFFGLEKQVNLGQFTLSLCETGTKSPILLLEKWWHDGSPSLIKAPPLLFTSTQDSFHRNRGQSHLKQISRPFESKRLPRTHGWLEISPQNKTLWDQTVPNFATLWWLWLFNIHGKVGQTFFICSPLIKATMHVIIFHSIFTPSSPTSSLSKSKPWAARSTVST